MSVREIEAAVHLLYGSLSKLDVESAMALFADDLEVFDHVPFRFDNKKQYAAYVTATAQALAQASCETRQLSCRMIGNDAAVANAYDTYMLATKDGKAQMIHARATLVFGRQPDGWKIVSAHFSVLPKD